MKSRLRGLLGPLAAGALMAAPLALAAAPAAVAADVPATGTAATVPAAVTRPAVTQATDLGSSTCLHTLPDGSVRLTGPVGIAIEGRVSGPTTHRIITVTGGSGSVGGLALKPDDFSGRLTLAGTTLSGRVVIDLPGHATLVKAWNQRTTLTLTPKSCAWVGAVHLRATGNGAHVSLSGPLRNDGTYQLRGGGSVSFASTSVPLSGWLRSPGFTSYNTETGAPTTNLTTTWLLQGSGRDGSMPGVIVHRPVITMTQADRGVTGAASLVVATPPLVAPASLRVGGPHSWIATVHGSNRDAWPVPGTSVTVAPQTLTGQVGMRGGAAVWRLQAPARARVDGLDIAGTFGITGASRYTLRADSATGTVLDDTIPETLTGGPGTLTWDHGAMSGSLSLKSSGERLLDMPDGWSASTTFILTPHSSRSWTFDRSLSHSLRPTNGSRAAIQLSGPVTDSGAMDLKVNGNLDIEGGLVPMHGYYRSTGFGQAPAWDISGTPSDARGGRIPLDGGAALVGGTIRLAGEAGATASRASITATPNPADFPAVHVTSTGISVQLANDDTFLLPVTYSYTDPNNWTITAAGTTPANVYAPFNGLAIPETAFHGTVTDTNGKQTWSVSVDTVDWVDMAIGIDYKGGLSLSNTCPLTAHCPSTSGIFVGGSSTLTFDDSTIGQVSAGGAFLTDKSWARWDATASPITINGITMSSPDLTIWKGTRDDTTPDLVMPDLSSLNGNSLGVEFCGDFTVAVPDISTVSTYGCAEWSHAGDVLAQVNTGGALDPGSYNGVSTKGVTLSGFAWSDVDQPVDVLLNGQSILMTKGKSYLTANVVIAGNVMHDFGAGTSKDTTIIATGWYDEDNFALNADIPVNLKGSGFTLDDITVAIGKQAKTFTLTFDANCDVVIDSHHYPLTVYIGYKHTTDSTITVGLSAKGTQATQTDGLMDFTNLVPSGDFEPTNATLVDGTFDGKLQPNIPKDGGFERSTNPGDIVTNGDFETGMGQNAMPDADFEDGSSGNILANGDFEDTNLLLNGDFEDDSGTSTPVGWTPTSSSYTVSLAPGSAVGPDDTGTTIAIIKNASSGTTTTQGVTQTIPLPLNRYGLAVSAWVSSNSSSATPFNLKLVGNGCDSAVSFTGTTVSAPVGSWSQATVSGTNGGNCDSVTVTLVAQNAGSSVKVDDVALSTPSAYGGNSVPHTWRPSIVGTFDSLAATPLMSGYSSGVSMATDYPGTLKSDGKQAWMLYSKDIGYAWGDFDIGYRVMFPKGSSSSQETRDMANFGYWLDGKYATMNGYCFRLQVNSTSADGGFYSCGISNGAGVDSPVSGMTKIPDVSRGVWYQVRLTAVGANVTAYVVNLSTNALVFTQTLKMPTQPGGYFGQSPGCCSSTPGIRWDDFTIYSMGGQAGQQGGVRSPTQVWIGDGNAHSGLGHGSLYTSTWANQPFQYSTGESPAQYATYTYSAWVRSPSGTVNGTIGLSATGGSSKDETTSLPFSVGTAWTLVSTTLQVQSSGHTDLRPGITIATTNAQLDIDDQVLQQVPWYPNQQASVQVTDAQAHSGLKSMAITASGDQADATYQFLGEWPYTGAAYTLSAWVLSPAGVSGYLDIDEQGGTTRKAFTGTGTWQQVTVTRTSAGGQYLRARIDINPGFEGAPLYVDDVSMTATGINSAQWDNSFGAPPPPQGWTATQYASTSNQLKTPKALALDDPTQAHSGSGSMVMPPAPSGYYQQNVFIADDSPVKGSTWTASVWVKTSAATSKGFMLQMQAGSDYTKGGNQAPTSFNTSGTGWQQFSVSLPITHSGDGPLTVTLTNYDTTGKVTMWIDDVTVTEAGLQPADAWTPYMPSGFVSVLGQDDTASAHTGSGYLEAINTGTGSASVFLDAAYKAVPGMTHEMSFWVRSPSGTSASGSGWLHTLDANGNNLDTLQVNYTANAAWQQVILSLPITQSSATTFRSEITLPGGATIDIDDVESRDVPTWDAVGSGSVLAIIDNADDAVSGANYLRTISTAAGGGMSATIAQDVDGNAIAIEPGDTFNLDVYVRTSSATSQQGSLSLATSAGDKQQVAFTATADWQQVSLTLTATKSASALTPQVTVASAGGPLDIDSLSLTPVVFDQIDPWSATGNGVTWQTIDDPTRAHDGSYGLMEFSTSNAGQGMQQSISATPRQGDVENVNAWVRSSTGRPISGTVKLTATGGTPESWQQGFSIDDTDWHVITFTGLVKQPSHTGFTVGVTQSTTGVTLDLDDVTVQDNPWQVTSDPGGSASQAIVYDGASAQSGTGFLQLLNTGSQGGDTYLDMPASQYMGSVTTNGVYAAGSVWQGTAYVRSDDPSVNVSGAVKLGTPGGTLASTSFTVGSEWTAIPVSFTVGSSSVSDLRMDIRVTTAGAKLDIDSVSISDGSTTPDGVTTALPHPQSGYDYLSDDAFGIPGSHLWALSAQIQFVADIPGLGVAGTVYHDPSKTPQIMDGTDWIKGDMVSNVSDADPCFRFDFSTTGNSSISVQGVLKAQDFSIAFAPRGCTVGLYTLPKGASFGFAATLGDSTLDFDIAVTEGADGPEFTEDIGVTDLNLGGIDFQEMDLSIDMTPTKSDISFVGDMQLPMGSFHGDYQLTSDLANGVNVVGDVDLEDWKLVGGGFDVEEFDFHMAMDVGPDNCGTFDDSTSGLMDMGKKTSLNFSGELKMSCGTLKVLHLQYDYHHGNVTQEFDLDYNSATDMLSGSVNFDFERSTSWRFFGYKYERHPRFSIALTYSMDMSKPASTLDATLDGTISVSGGDGSLECTINGGSGTNWVDDTCKLHVHVSVGGGHTYNADW